MPGFGIRNSTIFSGGWSRFDTDAQAWFNAGDADLPANYKSFMNERFIALKDLGLWDELKYGILPRLTLNDGDTLIEIKTATKLPGAALKGLDEVGFDRTLTCPVPVGFYMKASTEYIKTGAIPTSLHTLNDTCIAHGVLENVTGASTFNYSAFQGAANSLQANFRSGANAAIVDNYSNTSNAGRNTFSGVTDQSGDWLVNRRSATDIEAYRNGSSVGTAANGGGGLPNIEVYIGAQNSAGSPANYKNHTCTYHLQFSSLTAAERNNLITVINTYKTNLGFAITRNLIWDGNSLSKYENQNIARASLYYTYSFAKKLYMFRNFSIPGQTTADALADYAAQIAPEYSASYAKNIYVIHEVRNDIYTGATTAQAKTNIDSLINSAQATGYTVIVVCPTLTDYTGNTGRTETQFNLAIDEMVTYLIANAAGAEYVVQITDTDLWVPRSSYASDSAYNTAVAAKILGAKYLDGTHLTPTGYNSLGSIIATQALDTIA